MNRTYKIALTIGLLVVTGFLAWYFSTVVSYILISLVIAFIGQPLAAAITKIGIGNFRIGRPAASSLALIGILILLLLLIGIFIPIIIYEADMIANIDFKTLSKYLEKPVHDLNHSLYRYGVVHEPKAVEEMLTARLKTAFDFSYFTVFFSNLVTLTSSIYIGIFSILFISYFLIKDEMLFHNSVLMITPAKYQQEISRIMIDSRHMLSRYFIGLMLDVFSMAAMVTFGLWIFGVKNALLIGFIGGLMNIIPYLGPLIGGAIGVLLAITAVLSDGMYSGLGWIALKVAIVFAVAKLLDDFIFQPLIFSNSVKAHPLEIFLVIIMAGTIAGIPGMILAIPCYTVIRIIAREFFSRFRIVQKLTENL
jgi:predicted PurR-regulated permease PerM